MMTTTLQNNLVAFSEDDENGDDDANENVIPLSTCKCTQQLCENAFQNPMNTFSRYNQRKKMLRKINAVNTNSPMSQRHPKN